jgi:hypothetical protein
VRTIATAAATVATKSRRAIRKDAEEKLEVALEFWNREKFLFGLRASQKNGFFLAPTPQRVAFEVSNACLNF